MLRCFAYFNQVYPLPLWGCCLLADAFIGNSLRVCCAVTTLLLATAWMLFTGFAAAVKFHFRSDHLAPEMKMISVLSLFYLCVFTSLILVRGTTLHLAILAVVLMAAGGGLFIWAIIVTLQTRLPLAFDPTPSIILLRDGPYRFLRHPFYTSYMLCWLGCFAATPSIVLVPLIAGLAALYWIAIQREERLLLKIFGDQYLSYRRTAGWRNLLAQLRL